MGHSSTHQTAWSGFIAYVPGVSLKIIKTCNRIEAFKGGNCPQFRSNKRSLPPSEILGLHRRVSSLSLSLPLPSSPTHTHTDLEANISVSRISPESTLSLVYRDVQGNESWCLTVESHHCTHFTGKPAAAVDPPETSSMEPVCWGGGHWLVPFVCANMILLQKETGEDRGWGKGSKRKKTIIWNSGPDPAGRSY